MKMKQMQERWQVRGRNRNQRRTGYARLWGVVISALAVVFLAGLSEGSFNPAAGRVLAADSDLSVSGEDAVGFVQDDAGLLTAEEVKALVSHVGLYHNNAGFRRGRYQGLAA